VTTTTRTPPAERTGLLPRPAGEATPAFVLLAATAATLLVLGLVMAFSASFVRSARATGDAFELFTSQLRYAVIGLVPALVAAWVDYRRWRRFAVPALLAALVLCLLVLIPGIGREAFGARRWFQIGGLTVQPAELLKLALPVAIAQVVALRWQRIRAGDLRALLLPAVPFTVLGTALVFLEPDLETALLVAAIGGACLWVAGLPTRVLLVGGGVAVLLGLVGILSAGFRQGRIAAWLDPASDPSLFGYQQLQGYIALGSGGVFGRGLGQSRGAWGFVPNADTDFIFAIIGEELGLVGTLAVLALFAGIAVAGTLAARRSPDPFGRVVATGITAWLLLQAGINIGSVVGLLPVTGVTLPLVSLGGSSLVVTMVGVGLLLSVARAGREPGRTAAGEDRAP
jgi:cell division protein FtsW